MGCSNSAVKVNEDKQYLIKVEIEMNNTSQSEYAFRIIKKVTVNNNKIKWKVQSINPKEGTFKVLIIDKDGLKIIQDTFDCSKIAEKACLNKIYDVIGRPENITKD